MTNQVDPKDPQLQTWLAEGVSLEVPHPDSPLPVLAEGRFRRGGSHLSWLRRPDEPGPGNKPVAFRMPCCDSMNTVSPRFFAEIFNKTSPGGHFLSIDSSVFTVLTPDDPGLPRDLVFDPDGRERFRKYIPFPSFVNTIENYPYPYVIGRLCWEFPCIVPSDWEGQNINKPANPKTLEDLKAALDCVVVKQGVFNLVFHPHGWIKPEQVVELIDHAVKKHGNKVKFLNFREAQRAAEQEPARRQVAASAGRNGHRHPAGRSPMATVISKSREPASRPAEPPLPEPSCPGARLVDDQGRDAGLRFVDLDEDGQLDVVFSNDQEYGIYLFDSIAKGWTRKVMAGKAGDARGAAQDRPRRHQQRLLRPLATPLVAKRRHGQASQPGRSPLVQ